jgi:redox-sensitive bicupin YhaK (pirin superfamily)
LFAYPNLGTVITPFLLLDYAGPREFAPTSERRGVGEHPHRGFETVTIVYSGEVEHRDSSGGGGRIGPGDVQWMTAAGGIVHEEFHGRDFARRGGRFEMVQLWVNLPAKDKMAPPRYQSIVSSAIPSVSLPDGSGSVRVMSEFAAHGPAPFARSTCGDVNLKAGGRATFKCRRATPRRSLYARQTAAGGRRNCRRSRDGGARARGRRFSVEAVEHDVARAERRAVRGTRGRLRSVRHERAGRSSRRSPIFGT